MDYEAFYLPLALADLEEIYRSTAGALQTPDAAGDLAAMLDNAVGAILKSPYACPHYHAKRPLKAEYRELRAGGVVIYYVVKGDTVEIHRIIHPSKP
ncbi:MAG: type II toxin-antitoxin system RelE/ParE family toxin [Spirochaetaceae bacterium]|jgi:plasmid stabilization system protein ParE|nr:type II toxin-antitoxin system RelE/ParE family toxin [Spirochaetaceae bacterium]